MKSEMKLDQSKSNRVYFMLSVQSHMTCKINYSFYWEDKPNVACLSKDKYKPTIK